MSDETTPPGPTPEQLGRIKLLTWPMFVAVVDLLGFDRAEFQRNAAPAARALDFETIARAALMPPVVIEIALQWVVQARRAHLLKAVELLDLADPGTQAGTHPWLLSITGQVELKGVTPARLRAALDEAKGRRLGPNLGVDASAPADQPAWRGTDTASLEKIIGNENTLLPIHFLERALRCAAAVAKIDLDGGGSGSGFVIDGNLLVTCAHVLPDKNAAGNCRIIFDYQKDFRSLDLEPVITTLDPGTTFLCSPQHENDLAIVALAEPSGDRWQALAVHPAKVKKDDRVCIIQHPGGDQKHIGMFHNVVTYADETIVQYLTDTLPGSSGSPVFTQDWTLAAIHHAGGWLREPGRKEQLYRNEGIHAGKLVQLLESSTD